MDIQETHNEKKMSNVFYIYVNLQVEIFRKVHKEIVQILKIHKREDHKYGNSVTEMIL